MITSEYKGFTILPFTTEQRKDVAPDWRYLVSGDSFNPEGYTTLNNAKGAITKHLNARAERVADAITDVLEQVIEQKQKDKACASNGADVLAVPVLSVPVAQQKTLKVVQSRNKREGWYAGRIGARCAFAAYLGTIGRHTRSRKCRL